MKYLDFKDLNERLKAAEKLFTEDSTSPERFRALKDLIEGINPQIDKKLAKANKILTTLEKVYKQKVIQLTAENLPEDTKEEKRRKKLLLLFLSRWNKLKSEVKRVKNELERETPEGESQTIHTAKQAGRIARLAKGPLGAITAIAVVVAAGLMALDRLAVEVTIQNNGCDTLHPQVSVPISLPGLRLPTASIPSGSTATAEVPPLTFTVDGTRENIVNLSALGLNFDFAYSGNVQVNLDGQELIGTRTTVNLGSQKTHHLILSCPQPVIPANPRTQ
ncbi:MAG: hypothetical protein HYS86_03985 [Candidatus Chisholmbacteria bacterium]|nr:hypothetical protein [Candidatus Chisholmbacteria bacterium]